MYCLHESVLGTDCFKTKLLSQQPRSVKKSDFTVSVKSSLLLKNLKFISSSLGIALKQVRVYRPLKNRLGNNRGPTLGNKKKATNDEHLSTPETPSHPPHIKPHRNYGDGNGLSG